MNTAISHLYIVAGCNGAGKTTAFRTMLKDQLGNPEFVNPDAIAKSIDANHQWEVRMTAGRETIQQINVNIENGKTFCVETTLTSRSYVPMIKKARDKGYKVHLYYFWLESAEASYRRVLQRAKEGRGRNDVDNHMIPEDVIRRRYPKSVNNLFELFIPIVDSWHVYDNNLGLALPIADSDGIYDSVMWDIIKSNNPDMAISSVNVDRIVETIGIRKFSETVLLDKLKRKESVVYSIEGRVVKFTPDQILWLYENLQRDLDVWEIEHLKQKAKRGEEQYYFYSDKHFPASMILRLYGIHT